MLTGDTQEAPQLFVHLKSSAYRSLELHAPREKALGKRMPRLLYKYYKPLTARMRSHLLQLQLIIMAMKHYI